MLAGMGVVVVFLGVSSLVSRRKLILSLTFLVAFVSTILALIGGHALIAWYSVLTVLMLGALLLRNRARGTYLRGDSAGQSIFGDAADRRQRIGAGLLLTASIVAMFAFVIVGVWDTQTALVATFSNLLKLSMGMVLLSILIIFKPWKTLAWIQLLLILLAFVLTLILGMKGLAWLQVLVLLVPLGLGFYSSRMLMQK
jgi:hypothetical protein